MKGQNIPQNLSSSILTQKYLFKQKIIQKKLNFFSSQKEIYIIDYLVEILKKYLKKLKNTKPYLKKIINSTFSL